MEINQITFNPFQENTFILWDETKECIIIDPGCYEKNEKEYLSNFINFHISFFQRYISLHLY